MATTPNKLRFTVTWRLRTDPCQGWRRANQFFYKAWVSCWFLEVYVGGGWENRLIQIVSLHSFLFSSSKRGGAVEKSETRCWFDGVSRSVRWVQLAWSVFWQSRESCRALSWLSKHRHPSFFLRCHWLKIDILLLVVVIRNFILDSGPKFSKIVGMSCDRGEASIWLDSFREIPSLKKMFIHDIDSQN